MYLWPSEFDLYLHKILIVFVFCVERIYYPLES